MGKEESLTLQNKSHRRPGVARRKAFFFSKTWGRLLKLKNLQNVEKDSWLSGHVTQKPNAVERVC